MARLLDGIEYPRDVRKLSLNELPQLATEIREEVISVVSEVGGHLASTLGAVELTLALHYVFKTPEDRIVWDTGHQAYAHKLICGRRKRLATIRQLGGLSGFLSRDESEYDVFGAGHAGTSISAVIFGSSGFVSGVTCFAGSVFSTSPLPFGSGGGGGGGGL